jgi:hypothetical protein
VRVSNDNVDEEYEISVDSTMFEVTVLESTTDLLTAAVSVAAPLNYEDTQSYTFELTARGVDSGKTNTLSMSVDVLNVNEAPSFDPASYEATIAENEPTTTLFIVSASDPDTVTTPGTFDAAFGTFTYSLANFQFNTDSALFTVDPSTGAVGTAGPLNFEHRDTYSFQVVATDGGNSKGYADVVVHVTNVNEAPTFIRLSNIFVLETATAGTVIANVSTEDPDFDETFTYTINKTRTNNGLFQITNGQLVLAADMPEYHADHYTIFIESVDMGGLAVELSFEIRVVNENDRPTAIALYVLPTEENPELVELTSVPEDLKVDSIIGEFVVTDPDQHDYHTIVILDDDNGVFSVSGTYLILADNLDYETKTSHAITVKAVDSGYPIMESELFTFTFQVEDREDAPKSITFTLDGTLDENTQAGTVIGTISATDDDANQAMEFNLPAECPFTVGDVSCAVVDGRTECSAPVTLARQLDLESDELGCVVTAASYDGLSSDEYIELPVANVNEAPTDLVLEPAVVSEGIAVGRTVGYLTVVDVDDVEGWTFEIAEGSSDRFAVETRYNGGEARDALVVAAPLDFETSPLETVRVTVTDFGGASATFELQVTVTDLPMTLSATSLEVYEFVSSELSLDGEVVGTVYVNNQDRSDITVDFTISPEDGPFALIANGTVATVVVVDYPSIDYETVESMEITVTASFSSTSGDAPSAITKSFVVAILDASEGPVFFNEFDRAIEVDTNAPSGFEVVDLNAADPDDASATIVYSIVSGNDAGAFTISRSSGRLTVALTPSTTDVPKGTEFVIVVSATDGELATTIDVPVIVVASVDSTVAVSNFSEATTSNKASSITIAAAVSAGVLLMILVVLAVFIRRRNAEVFKAPVAAPAFSTASNPMYASTAITPSAPKDNFVGGVANPLYAWYRPDASRDECVAALRGQTPGTFIVRDYKPTPTWHMVHVKAPSNEVVDGKIRYTASNSTYDLVVAGPSQPIFESVPALINHYSTTSDPTPFRCPLTTAPQGPVGHRGLALEEDTAAPALPLKDTQRAMIQQMALAQDEDIYNNTVDARAALHASTMI